MQPPFRRFDHHVPPHVRHVAETAVVLGVGEAEVFRHAYRWRYERELSEPLLDETFGGYLLRREVPQWVRDYCRRVLNLAAGGQLDPRDFGVTKPTVYRLRPAEQHFASFATLGALLLYFLFFA